MLDFLGPRAIPGVESVESGVYRRSICFRSNHGFLEVSLDDANSALVVRVFFGDSRALFAIIERIRMMFDLNADWATVARTLRSDLALAPRLDGAPGLRVPGCWDGFELAIRAILGQQVSVKGATTLSGRLVRAFGRHLPSVGGLTHLFPTPKVLSDADCRNIGIPRARAETIRALARAVSDGQIKFEGIVNSDEFLSRLCQIPGIGRWTAQYIAMRALREPDAFPSGDLGLLRALRANTVHELESRAEAWRPWRAYAAMYLWSTHSALAARAGSERPKRPRRFLKAT